MLGEISNIEVVKEFRFGVNKFLSFLSMHYGSKNNLIQLTVYTVCAEFPTLFQKYSAMMLLKR